MRAATTWPRSCAGRILALAQRWVRRWSSPSGRHVISPRNRQIVYFPAKPPTDEDVLDRLLRGAAIGWQSGFGRPKSRKASDRRQCRKCRCSTGIPSSTCTSTATRPSPGSNSYNLEKQVSRSASAFIIFIISMLGIAPAASEPNAYVTNEDSGSVSIIDTRIDKVTSTLKVGDKPRGIATSRDGARLYIRDHTGTLVERDLFTYKTSSKKIGKSPNAIYVSPDGKVL